MALAAAGRFVPQAMIDTPGYLTSVAQEADGETGHVKQNGGQLAAVGVFSAV
jgi:hypothetical protein